MPKQKYFISKEDFVEPFGLEIKKGSLFSHLSNEHENLYSVLYYDDEENSVYPIYAPKNVMLRIKPTDVDKEKRILFEQWKQDEAKGKLRTSDVVLENSNRKFTDPEERRKHFIKIFEKYGIEVESVSGVDAGSDKIKLKNFKFF